MPCAVGPKSLRKKRWALDIVRSASNPLRDCRRTGKTSVTRDLPVGPPKGATGARRTCRAACSGSQNIRTKLLFTMSENQAGRFHGPQLAFNDKRRCPSPRIYVRHLLSGTFAPKAWWSQTESNRRPPACKAGALPTELWPQGMNPGNIPEIGPRTCTNPTGRMVGLGRFELPTSPLSGVRSNQLSYRPTPCPKLHRDWIETGRLPAV